MFRIAPVVEIVLVEPRNQNLGLASRNFFGEDGLQLSKAANVAASICRWKALSQ